MKFLNKKMKILNKKIKNSKLGELICPEFYEFNNCVCLKLGNTKTINEAKKWAEMICEDKFRVDFEWNNNSVEYQYVIKFNDNNEKKDFGVKLVEIWKEKLQKQFPNYSFGIMLSFGDNAIIRFHKLRNDEIDYINEKNIEGFKEEAVLIEKIKKENR